MPNTTLWLGSEASYHEALAALAKVESHFAQGDNEDPSEPSPYLSVVDGVGIITVQGSLLDGTYGRIGQWYGITGYGDIQGALVQAVKNPDVQALLMVYKSGGGAVAGINETVQLIRSVDAVKPVFAYTPSTMCSAALWAGVSARKVFASDTAIVGSVGVLSMVVSRHRQLKEDGVDAVIIRSGKYKALGHVIDPMSDLAVKEAQSQIDALAKVFLSYVSDRRGVSASAGDTKFGEGRVFVGQAAKTAGLVDDIVTYSQAFAAAKASAPTDNKTRVFASGGNVRADMAHNVEQPKGQTSMSNSTHIPSEAELLAMAGGAAPEDKPEADAAAKAAAEAAAAEAAAAAAAATNAPEAAAELATAKEALAASQAELATAKEALVAATAKVEELTAAKAAVDTVQAALAGIVKVAVKSMSLPLNKKTDTVDAMTAEQLVAAHGEVSELFRAKIKAGGVAAPSKTVAEGAQPEVTAVNPLFAAAAHLNKARKGA